MSVNRRRILHLITGLSRGGAQMLLRNLIGAHDRNAFEMRVITLRDEQPVGDEIRSLGVPVTHLAMSSPWPNVAAVRALISEARHFNPHWVHTWLYHADLAGGILGRAIGARVLWHLHVTDFRSHRLKHSTRMVAYAAARLSRVLPHHIIACSQTARTAHLELGYDDSRISVIPNGIDLARFCPVPDDRESIRDELGLPSHAPVIGCLARFDPQKDFRTLLRATKIVFQSSSDVRLLLVGPGLDNNNGLLRRWIDDLGLDRRRIWLLGERRDTERVLRGLDVFALSSVSEALSLALLEAMATQIPCVLTNVGDHAQAVGESGWVVPPRDTVALAEALCTAIDCGPEERSRRGIAARSRVAAHYNLENVTERIQRCYT